MKLAVRYGNELGLQLTLDGLEVTQSNLSIAESWSTEKYDAYWDVLSQYNQHARSVMATFNYFSNRPDLCRELGIEANSGDLPI